MDTTDLALKECNAWFLANEEAESGDNATIPIPRNPCTFTCRVDGSWKNDGFTSGVG